VKPVPVTARAILMVVLAAMLGSHAPFQERRLEQTVSATNPRELHALQLLDRRTPGAPPRIRLEWDPVQGARRYVLTGRWASPPSWTIQSEQHRITPQNATAWEPHRVAFEVALPEGTHSWSVVALFGADEHGDFAHPTSVTFEVR
jgi:hypothetical protein